MEQANRPSRRRWLRSLIGASGLAGLDSVFTAAPSSAAQIDPKKDNLKVTKLETFILKNSWVFVKISTNAGITGWGEMLKDDAKACAGGAQEVGRYLVGQDPLRVVFHWQAIHRGAFYRGGPIKSAILSGIDQALWDIKAGSSITTRRCSPAERSTSFRAMSCITP
jgi:galactonate dehydratase